MKNLIYVLLILFTSCGNQIKLNYDELEIRFNNLTPYWEYVIKNDINTDNAVRFSSLYKDSQSLIIEFKDPSRQVGTGGTVNVEDRNDTIILWELNNALNWAETRTNNIIVQ